MHRKCPYPWAEEHHDNAVTYQNCAPRRAMAVEFSWEFVLHFTHCEPATTAPRAVF